MLWMYQWHVLCPNSHQVRKKYTYQPFDCR
jgi:hypothetical protein